MADGYSRASGRHGVCIAQNGPRITNFVTAIAASFWAHSPVVMITPETVSNTQVLGGFQEAISLFQENNQVSDALRQPGPDTRTPIAMF
jgi:sulfoacetaldehyde acetyltransferase